MTGDGTRGDSLRAENMRLKARANALQDSLRFRDDVQTGQYYREQRTLQDKIMRLTYEVRTLRDGGQTVAVLPVDDLFDTATLTDTGVERLRAVAEQLETAYPNRRVRVEGHSDRTPLSESLQERFPSNWALSSARAAAVVHRLITLTSLNGGQFAAVGYGTTDPVATNNTAQGRQQNRRIRIAVLPAPRDYSRPFETTW
jgi:chemotaxis protein MotB